MLYAECRVCICSIYFSTLCREQISFDVPKRNKKIFDSGWLVICGDIVDLGLPLIGYVHV